MKKTFTKITATTLAILTVLFTFCLTSFASEKQEGADVYIGSVVISYKNMEDAWNAAVNADVDSKIVLKGDWTADSDGNFGTGKNFCDGSLTVKRKIGSLTIDLNGYKIDRGLKTARKVGAVFFLYVSTVIITDTSEAGTGVITGGYNSANGGAFMVDYATLTVKNVRIENNISEKKGGALWAQGASSNGFVYKSRITFDNCQITGNKANKGGAVYIDYMSNLKIFDSVITKNSAVADAGIHTEVEVFNRAEVVLGGKVIIADNTAEKDGTGLMLDESLFTKVYIQYEKERPLEDGSRIVILSKTGDRTLRITADSDEFHTDCYEYENDRYEIIEKGSGNEKYLDIKKI